MSAARWLRRRPWRSTKVTVVYKSGATITLRCRSFSVSQSNRTGEITKLEWVDAKPRPLRAGLEEIAAVWTRNPLR